jgi:L-amino acid N-acyltransferase YncA
MNYSIESASIIDAAAITEIYNHYIRETVITFELTEITSSEMESRMERTMKTYPWLVIKVDGKLLGYAYATAWRERKAYAATAETTIYMSPEAIGKGLGKPLYEALITEMKAQQFHVLMGVIALPNRESAALHERLGFSKAAHFSEVGFKFNRWVDVGYWQMIL